MKITKKALHDRFTASEEVLGAYDGDYDTGQTEAEFLAVEGNTPDMFEASTMLPNKLPMSCCTNSAVFVCAELGHGDIYGFSAESNPVQNSAINRGSGGHDFAVIHSRYIVDPWISLYTGNQTQGVFDLRDPKDSALIKDIYGDPAKWDLRLFVTRLAPEGWSQGRRSYAKPEDADYPQNKRLAIGRPVSAPSFSI
ncbi:MAG: hypothetical protein RSD49_08425 [Hafnia sp.]